MSTATGQARVVLRRIGAILESGLSTRTKLVACVLAACMGNEAVCWVPLFRLQALSSLSASTVKEALRELEREGWIEVLHGSRGIGVMNGYGWRKAAL